MFTPGHDVEVDSIPQCDFCDPHNPSPAYADGRTNHGPWGYMCEKHFRMHGVGTGTGKGQRLHLRSTT